MVSGKRQQNKLSKSCACTSLYHIVALNKAPLSHQACRALTMRRVRLVNPVSSAASMLSGVASATFSP